MGHLTEGVRGQTDEGADLSTLPMEPGAAETPEDKPELSPLREVRLAVVMYGGVSLAIYMNGVAQELFHLVRATAPAGPDDGTPFQRALPSKELRSSEAAYRRLAQSISDSESDSMSGLADPNMVHDTSPILVRYLVDILSGSSAGGINAVFLAKALANDQAMDGLTKLWLDAGDIGTLLNDRKSKLDGLPAERPPQSLLSSERMYVNLLEAFHQMEESNGTAAEPPRRSPYARELDLFVTTTDLTIFGQAPTPSPSP